MRIWVTDKVELKHGVYIRAQADPFNTKDDQRRPQEVKKLRGNEEHAERSLRSSLFCCERNGIMSDKHGVEGSMYAADSTHEEWSMVKGPNIKT